MSFLLYTPIYTRTLENGARIRARIQEHAGKIALSAISIMEAEVWLTTKPARLAQSWFALERLLTVIDINADIAHRAALLTGDLRRRGYRIGLADSLIAATALERDFTLVTRSLATFQLVTGLIAVDWSQP